MTPARILALVLVACLGGPLPAQAQIGDLLKRVLPADKAAAAPAGVAPTDSAVLANAAPPVGPKKDIVPELQPDLRCNRPRERFNVAEKLLDYGGTAAQRRLQRLLETDFEHSQLTPEDRQMLDYLAKTTVWLPPEAESRIGSVQAGSRSLLGLVNSADKLSELDEAALQLIRQRLDQLKTTVQDFPADVQLTVDKTLPDGAFARFGATIVLSDRFLSGMTERPENGDFVLAHELSHVYKRHAVKLMQYQLIATAEGWDLGRKLLRRAYRGLGVDPMADGVFLFTTMPALVLYVQKMQLKFNQDQEVEADACSTVWLAAAGMPPVAAWQSFRASLAASDGEKSYARSHPVTDEREKRVLAKSAELSVASAPPQLKARHPAASPEMKQADKPRSP